MKGGRGGGEEEEKKVTVTHAAVAVISCEAGAVVGPHSVVAGGSAVIRTGIPPTFPLTLVAI